MSTPADVVATNPDAQSDTLVNGFQYLDTVLLVDVVATNPDTQFDTAVDGFGYLGAATGFIVPDPATATADVEPVAHTIAPAPCDAFAEVLTVQEQSPIIVPDPDEANAVGGVEVLPYIMGHAPPGAIANVVGIPRTMELLGIPNAVARVRGYKTGAGTGGGSSGRHGLSLAAGLRIGL